VAGGDDAGRQAALGAAAKRSSPDVTQTEISGLAFELSFGAQSLQLRADELAGTTAAASPKAESSRKLLREVVVSYRGPQKKSANFFNVLDTGFGSV